MHVDLDNGEGRKEIEVPSMAGTRYHPYNKEVMDGDQDVR